MLQVHKENKKAGITDEKEAMGSQGEKQPSKVQNVGERLKGKESKQTLDQGCVLTIFL